MKKITNNKIILGILIVALFLLTAGITYAYFSIVVSGNEQAKTIKVSTTTLELRYTDSLEISAVEIFPEWTTTKTVTVENTGTDKVYYSLGWQNLINTVENNELVVSAVCDTCGNIEETPVAYTLGVTAEANKVVYPLKENIEINAGETHTYTLTFTFKETGEVQNYNQGKKFTGVLGIAESTKPITLLSKILEADTPQSDASIDFTKDKDGCYYDAESNTIICPEGCSLDPDTSEITCEEGKGDTNGKGLYYTSDTSKTENNEVVYYYRGDVNNNYVVFAGECFRIVRTNEDGSIKLVNRGSAIAIDANGAYGCPTNEYIDPPIYSAFNTNYNDNAYVGYMYGTAGSSTYELTHANTNDSTVKAEIDTWYENTFNEKERTLIVDTIYCNDRSLAEGEFTFFGNTAKNTEISGYGQNETYYSGMKRLLTGTPQYKCSQTNDKFTVSSAKGNGALKYPVALLTADEAMYAGNTFGTISNNYLYLQNYEWLMTASAFYGGRAVELGLDRGSVLNDFVNYNRAALPAVSLSSNIQIEKGDGTINNPYVVANQEDMIEES